VEPTSIEEYVQKTVDVYNGMKEHHPFLTNSGDYPLASILGQCEKSKDEIIVNVENHYNALKEKDFLIGNDLQFLSHILALNTDQKPDERAESCFKIQNLLNKAHFKSKRIYYPYIGMLSYLEDVEDEIESLKEIYENLNNDKLFKWNKDINFMLSVLFLMNEKTPLGDAARAGLYTTIEILIKAQQAAMTASITAATVASNISSGDRLTFLFKNA
jgi:hypothetical protein